MNLVRILIGVLSDSAPRGCYQRDTGAATREATTGQRGEVDEDALRSEAHRFGPYCGRRGGSYGLSWVFSEVRLALAPKDCCRSGRRSAWEQVIL